MLRARPKKSHPGGVFIPSLRGYPATFALALAIASLPFTIAIGAQSFQSVDIDSRLRFPVAVKHSNNCAL